MTNANNNDVVMINLDRPRELRYGHKAMKKLQALTGASIENIDMDNFDAEKIEIFLYCGLLSDARDNDETLKMEQMEDLLDMASYEHLIEKMQEAFASSFGKFMVGNPQAAAGSPNRGTGKNR